jgi:hypothetical protein
MFDRYRSTGLASEFAGEFTCTVADQCGSGQALIAAFVGGGADTRVSWSGNVWCGAAYISVMRTSLLARGKRVVDLRRAQHPPTEDGLEKSCSVYPTNRLSWRQMFDAAAMTMLGLG